MQKKTALITTLLIGSFFLQGFSFDKMMDKVTDFKKFKNPSDMSPKEVVETTKRFIYDSVACAYGGYHTKDVNIIRDLYKDMAGKEEATVIGFGEKIPAVNATLVNSLMIRARKHTDDHGIKHYEIYGPLFFGSIELFNSKFDVKNDPKEVVIDFAESRVVDQSAIEALNKLAERYQKNGKTIHLRHLSADCVKLIKRAEKICDVNVLEDPDYFVAIDDYNQALERV